MSRTLFEDVIALKTKQQHEGTTRSTEL